MSSLAKALAGTHEKRRKRTTPTRTGCTYCQRIGRLWHWFIVIDQYDIVIAGKGFAYQANALRDVRKIRRILAIRESPRRVLTAATRERARRAMLATESNL